MSAPGEELIRLPSSIVWELRAYWAKGLRVSVQIDGDEKRIEGHVRSVSATGAYAVVADLHVPADRILAVYRPSRLGDSSYEEGTERWQGWVPPAARRDPHQLEIPGL